MYTYMIKKLKSFNLEVPNMYTLYQLISLDSTLPFTWYFFLMAQFSSTFKCLLRGINSLPSQQSILWQVLNFVVTLSTPFWCLCQKLSLSLLYFNKLYYTHTHTKINKFCWILESYMEMAPDFTNYLRIQILTLVVHTSHFTITSQF